jgi:hypothetical protein
MGDGDTSSDRESDQDSNETSPSTSPMPPIHLPNIITPALLSRIRSHPQLPKHTWYIVSSVTLSCLNRPNEIPTILKSAIGKDGDKEKSNVVVSQEDQLKIARRMREGLVKSSAICGLPKVINTLLWSFLL